jgi:hypothetical protein
MVKVGNFTKPEHEQFLTSMLVDRRRILLHLYFSGAHSLIHFAAG